MPISEQSLADKITAELEKIGGYKVTGISQNVIHAIAKGVVDEIKTNSLVTGTTQSGGALNSDCKVT